MLHTQVHHLDAKPEQCLTLHEDMSSQMVPCYCRGSSPDNTITPVPTYGVLSVSQCHGLLRLLEEVERFGGWGRNKTLSYALVKSADGRSFLSRHGQNARRRILDSVKVP